MSSINNLRDEYAKRSAVTDASKKVYELTRKQYDLGFVDYFSVSDASRLALANERTQISLRGDRFKACVDFIAAIGGGWELPKDDDQFRPPQRHQARLLRTRFGLRARSRKIGSNCRATRGAAGGRRRFRACRQKNAESRKGARRFLLIGLIRKYQRMIFGEIRKSSAQSPYSMSCEGGSSIVSDASVHLVEYRASAALRSRKQNVGEVFEKRIVRNYHQILPEARERRHKPRGLVGAVFGGD